MKPVARLHHIRLEASWKIRLLEEFDQPYMQALREFLAERKKKRHKIYPKGEAIFKAFELSPYHKTKVVILGQDPYHGPNQAHGLAFSVPKAVPPPPSLINIFKELRQDLGIDLPDHGCLSEWAKQGVLLLNSVLTVEDGSPAAHQGQGWEKFTDKVIQTLNIRPSPVVFVLWGAYAQNKGKWIDSERHCVLKAPHPSPLSAHRGFLGCRHFSKINAQLMAWGQTPIDWTLTPLKPKDNLPKLGLKPLNMASLEWACLTE